MNAWKAQQLRRARLLTPLGADRVVLQLQVTKAEAKRIRAESARQGISVATWLRLRVTPRTATRRTSEGREYTARRSSSSS